ncbi:MAG: pyridoxamine 5'-phosphate oxidase family protein [Hyphomicrobiales bacterium]|nr:pyridoxamine 5'-phosphate oxidase family protein [Hyphomicrobiales bacterium]MBV8439082.1 pyridoxamine 5'-phosphate oxidase family protein [Hyphomicrobiales bacterium]
MSRAEDERDRVEVSRLLAGAMKAIASVRYCWLATEAKAGGPNVIRPMGRLPPEPGDKEWTIWFVTDGRSRKASDIRRAGKVALIFQHDADDAFVALTGAAALQESASEVRRRWKDAYNRYFPTEADRAAAAFVEVEAERMELWIRGVTPEPFGLRATTLERDAAGAWRLIGG